MTRQAASVEKWSVPASRGLDTLTAWYSDVGSLFSQAVPEQKKAVRHKLGSVLEGGGALGLEHIGVITWMEEHRIPVGYVAGTSHGRPGRRNLWNRSISGRGQRTHQQDRMGSDPAVQFRFAIFRSDAKKTLTGSPVR
jgi:hypothetical protein